MDEQTFDGVFWLSFSGVIVGIIGVMMKMCFKSKCKNLEICWGCLHLERDVLTEEKLDEFNVIHHVPPETEGSQNPPPQSNKRLSFTRILPL